MPFCRSKYVKKVVKLIAFIFEHPSQIKFNLKFSYLEKLESFVSYLIKVIFCYRNMVGNIANYQNRWIAIHVLYEKVEPT